MGLSGRKEKQKIPNDPRNLSWADNATKFGQVYLSKLGWDSSKGLGASGDGRTSHIKVSQKLDMLGIGAANSKLPNGIAWKQNKDFEALLKRLNESDQSNSVVEETKIEVGIESEEQGGRLSNVATSIPVPAPRHMAHRARLRASKNIAMKSSVAISEILGIAPTPSSSASPSQMPGTLTQLEDVHQLEKITTSTKSVADYFKDRLNAKSSSSGSPSPSSLFNDDQPSRAGLGTSRLRLEADGGGAERLRTGLRLGTEMGANKFGSLMSGAFLSSLPAITSEIPPVEDSKAEETTEDEKERKRRRKAEKKEKRKREKDRDTESAVPTNEDDDAEGIRRKRRRHEGKGEMNMAASQEKPQKERRIGGSRKKANSANKDV